MSISWDAAAIDALLTLWPEAKGSLSSAHLYRYLQEHQTQPPRHGMQTLLAMLQREHQIAGAQGINPEREATDGALLITWVSPDLGRRAQGWLGSGA